MKGIKNKLLISYCILIVITVLTLESIFLIYTSSYYYGSIKNYLKARGDSVNEIYNTYMPNKSFNQKARDLFKSEISHEENIRVQIIDLDGNILIDNYGLKVNKKVNSKDVDLAIETGERAFTSTKEGDEDIYSLSIPLKGYSYTKGVIRYTVSLEKAKDVINKFIVLCIVIGIVVLLIVTWLSSILSKGIVEPINDLKSVAEVMAGGNYKVRAKKSTDDELGELANSFNYMAEEIQKTAQIKNDFISSISHELRTPLTSIQGWSETLMYAGDDEERELGLNIIQGETKRLIKIVEELLDFSRYERNKMEFNMTPLDLGIIVKEVVNQYRIKAKEKNIRMTLKIESDNNRLVGDEDRLKQVFINLLENSWKFTDYGGRIEVRLQEDEENLIATVQDNGIGIEEENLQKVFDKFFKENTNMPGSGIGLSLCSEIVKAHNGTISLKSSKGLGTKFTIAIKKNS